MSRLVVADHKMGDVYLVAMHEVASAASVLAAEAWVEGTAERLEELCAEGQDDPSQQMQSNALQADEILEYCCSGSAPEASSTSYLATQSSKAVSSTEAVQAGETAVWQDFTPLHSREKYEAAVCACQEALHSGESYELCLTTNQSRAAAGINPLALYHELRRRNPAAHAAWLSFGNGGPQVHSIPSMQTLMCEWQSMYAVRICICPDSPKTLAACLGGVENHILTVRL